MREIVGAERHEILSLKSDDITQKKLVELFASTSKGEARFNTNDKIKITANKHYNKTELDTTVGKYIFNMFALPESYLKKFGYNNNPMNRRNLGTQETNMADMILVNELKPEDYLVYMQKGE